MRNRDKRRRQAQEAGEAAAGWMFDGNTSRRTYLRFLEGFLNGDPLILDTYAPPLWLRESEDEIGTAPSIFDALGITDSDSDAAINKAIGEYELDAEDAYWSSLEREAVAQTEDE